MRVATLNTWHGLDGVGLMRFGLLETQAEQIARRERQSAALRALDPHILLLQEVNPLPFRAYSLARSLDRTICYGAANVGVKVGWGPPWNLNEGLCVLAPRSWRVERLGTRMISGGMSFSPPRVTFIHSPFLGFQLKEARSAFAVRVHRPAEFGGGTMLVAVTHLHHAPARTRSNDDVLAGLQAEGLEAHEEAHILKCLERADARRMGEVREILAWLQALARPGEDVLLGGDFNCEPESRPYGIIRDAGFIDLWERGGGGADLARSATWDPPHNALAYRVQGFEQPGADYSERVGRFFRRSDLLPRRIDFLFLKKADGRPAEVTAVDRFGLVEKRGEAFVPSDFSTLEERKPYSFVPEDDLRMVSDHFGIYADLKA